MLGGIITDLSEHGRLYMPHGKPMSGHKNLFEIRYSRHRILYAVKSGKAILLHAFIKKSQQTPKLDLDLAEGRLKQWMKG